MKINKINAQRDRKIAKKVNELNGILNDIGSELTKTYQYYITAAENATSFEARVDANNCAILTENAMRKYWDVLGEIHRAERALTSYNILSEQMKP